MDKFLCDTVVSWVELGTVESRRGGFWEGDWKLDEAAAGGGCLFLALDSRSAEMRWEMGGLMR